MDRDDVVGAKAAAQYFIEFYPYVYATGDLEEWRAMSQPECIFCTSVIDNVEELHRDGGYGLGAEITVEEVAGAEPVEGNPYFSVDLRVYQAPAAEYSATGAQLDADSGGRPCSFSPWSGRAMAGRSARCR